MKINFREIFSESLPVIQKFAPSIAGAIGGPTGFAIGYIVPVLASAFGSRPGDIKQLVSNILVDPNAKEKLEQIEHEHSDWLCSVSDSVDRLISAEINIKLNWTASS